MTSTGLPGLFDIIDRQQTVNRDNLNKLYDQQIIITELSAKIDRSRFWMIVALVECGLIGVLTYLIMRLV